MFQRLLCAMDGSEHSLRAANHAAALASRFGASLSFLTVTKEIKVTDEVRRYLQVEQLAGEPQYVLDEHAQSIMRQARQTATKAGINKVETLIRTGQPARTIVQVAEEIEADTIVMGSRGLGDIEGLLLGSVSHKVATLAKCTCITVK
ncbi:MAG TPA: universal stress protein [Kiloniellales bacterium]|nr:universal stress protein [Kiloniellales bacterium]